MIDLMTPTTWAFLQNYHLDKSNACVHMAPVKFSPLTFALGTLLISMWPEDEDLTAELAEVREHLGAYELDGGR